MYHQHTQLGGRGRDVSGVQVRQMQLCRTGRKMRRKMRRAQPDPRRRGKGRGEAAGATPASPGRAARPKSPKSPRRPRRPRRPGPDAPRSLTCHQLLHLILRQQFLQVYVTNFSPSVHLIILISSLRVQAYCPRTAGNNSLDSSATDRAYLYILLLDDTL